MSISRTRDLYCFPHFCGFGICGAGKSGKDEKPRLRERGGGEEALGKVLPEIGAKPGDVREIFALMTPCASNFSWVRTSFLTPVHAPWPKIYLSPVLFSFALSNSKSSVK